MPIYYAPASMYAHTFSSLGKKSEEKNDIRHVLYVYYLWRKSFLTLLTGIWDVCCSFLVTFNTFLTFGITFSMFFHEKLLWSIWLHKYSAQELILTHLEVVRTHNGKTLRTSQTFTTRSSERKNWKKMYMSLMGKISHLTGSIYPDFQIGTEWIRGREP